MNNAIDDTMCMFTCVYVEIRTRERNEYKKKINYALDV